MHVIHGTWIPEATHEFIQKGAFYLWVETDTPMGESRSRAGTVHPRHLGQSALSTFLTEKLGLREFAPGALARTLSTKYFLLPTAASKPAPCFELLRYVDEEEPIEFDLAPWQVCCYQVTDIIATLNDIHFIALHAAEDFQLGADLLFWYQYSQAIKGIIAKDQYIPAQKYQEICSQLEVLCRVKGDKMDIVQRGDDVCHLVAADLPGCQVKLYRLLLIHIAQQFKARSRLARSRREQKVFGTQGTRQ